MKKMISKLVLIFILISLSTITTINAFNIISNNQSFKCDTYLKDVIEIDIKMIHYFKDAKLKYYYTHRNLNRKGCLMFYKKLLTKLQEVFAFLDR